MDEEGQKLGAISLAIPAQGAVVVSGDDEFAIARDVDSPAGAIGAGLPELASRGIKARDIPGAADNEALVIGNDSDGM